MKIEEARAIAQELAHEGVVAVSVLTERGISPDLVKKLKGGPDSSRVYGVLRLDDRPLTPLVKAHVARAVAGSDCVLSGWLACLYLGLRWVDEGRRVTAVIPAQRQRRSRGWVRVRRSTAFEAVPTVEKHGLLLADVPWAVVDAAREVSERRDCSDVLKVREVRGIVLGAVHADRCTPDELLRVLALTGTQHSALARRACRDAERGAVSPPEAEMVDDALALGVPFYANVAVWVRGRFLGIADGWLVGTGVGWESDSKEEHGEGEKLDATFMRSERFRLAGAHLAHVTPSRYRTEGLPWWEREVFAEVRRRQAAGLGDPPGLQLRDPRGPLLFESTGSPPYPLPDLTRCILAADDAAVGAA